MSSTPQENQYHQNSSETYFATRNNNDVSPDDNVW